MSPDNISDSFRSSSCSICGYFGVHQYFVIHETFIDYYGIFYSLHELINEALDFQISQEQGIEKEICLDCKDKVIKFFHFKRKVKEIRLQNISHKTESIPRSSKNKVVKDILQIVESYAKTCSITSVFVEVKDKKLIFESKDNLTHPTDVLKIIKSRSLEVSEIKSSKKHTVNQSKLEIDDREVNRLENHNDYSEISRRNDLFDNLNVKTNKSTSEIIRSNQQLISSKLPYKKSPTKFSDNKFQLHAERRRKRMELLRLPNNLDLYEKHKAQSRERTRRYREKLRQQKLLAQNVRQSLSNNTESASESLNHETVSFLQYAEIKLEVTSDDDEITFS